MTREIDPKIKMARQLRKEQTQAEAVLWFYLRNRQFLNLKFRRQHPLKDYILDFFCIEYGIVIELDGGYHNDPEQKTIDKHRDKHLSLLGYKILRFSNTIALHEPEKILASIEQAKKEQEPYKQFKEESVSKKDGEPEPLSPALSQGRGSRILSTKRLTTPQKTPLLAAGYKVEDYDAITTVPLEFEFDAKADYYIFTSQNAVNHFMKQESHPSPRGEGPGVRGVFCVGDKTKLLLQQNGFNVLKSAENVAELAEFLVKNHKNDSFLFFCGKRRMPTLRQVFDENNMELHEVEVYDTVLQGKLFPQSFDAILFFSPSGVESYCRENDLHNTFAYCIGPTTAHAVRLYTNHICIAEEPTVEATVKAVLDNPPALTE